MPNDAQGASPLPGPTLECFTVLAGLAAATEGVRLGSLVVGNLYRHPAVVANAAASIDHISAGRCVLGLGAGWQVNEHAAFGIDLLDTRTRLDRLEESAQIIASMLHQERTSFTGQHYQVSDAPCEPRPVQEHLPLLIGGGGEQRTLRIAARLADEWNVWSTPDSFRHKSSVLDRRCEERDRDPAQIRRSTQAMVFLSTDEAWLAERRQVMGAMPGLAGTPAEMVDQLGAYQEAGVDEFIVPDWTMGSVDRTSDTLALFWAEVASHLQ
jgi:F420-dependent oxidoreductase-like protein